MRFQIYPWLIRPTAALPSAFLSPSVQATLALSPPGFHRRVTLLRWYRPPTHWNSPLPEEIVVVVVVVVLVALHPWNSHRFEGLTGQTKLGNLMKREPPFLFRKRSTRFSLSPLLCCRYPNLLLRSWNYVKGRSRDFRNTVDVDKEIKEEHDPRGRGSPRGRFSTEILTEDRSKFGHLRRHTIDLKR